jgi:hypothetical protein
MTTTRKRKSPKGKGKRRQPGFALQGAALMGTLGLRGAGALGWLGLRGASLLSGMVGRHPSVAGGSTAFVVVFSFIAANALWYQPGSHPSPMFRTRDPNANIMAVRKAFFHTPNDAGVTTFRIERAIGATEPSGTAGAAALPVRQLASKSASTGGPKVPAPRPQEDVTSLAAAADPVAAAILKAEKSVKTALTPKRPQNDALDAVDMVMQIQKGLRNIAYSDVSVDGVAGDQTRAAIRRFQKHYQLPETGEPDMAVLQKLRDIGAL